MLADMVGTSKCWRVSSVFLFLFSSHLGFFNIPWYLWEFLFNIYYSTIRYIQNWKFLHIIGFCCSPALLLYTQLCLVFFEEKSVAAKKITGLQSSYAAIPSSHTRFCFLDCFGWNSQTSTYAISTLHFPGASNCSLILTPHETDYLWLKAQFQIYAGYFHCTCAARSILVGIPLRSFCSKISVIWFTCMFRWCF